MKRTRNVLLILCATSVWSAGAFAQHPTDPVVPGMAVLAQNLTKLESTGKVNAALWTLRNDSCTLQLVLPWSMWDRNARPHPLERTGVRIAALPREVATLPEVKVWLLTASGAQIAATNVTRPDPKNAGPRTIAAEYSYSFPRWVNGQAVAAAIQIGDDFYIEKLEKLADQPL